MSVEEKGGFLGMALTPWEEDIFALPWSNSGEKETHLCKSGDEAFSNEIVGSLVEAAALLVLEDNNNNNNCDQNNIYGGLERENNAAIPASINAKKEEHNAKERERRMKLSHTFFSLRSLLPNARRSKSLSQKRWSSATIIDKVVDYIPTVEKEIENLKQKKLKLKKVKEMSNNGRVVEGLEIEDNSTSVSIHQLCKGEVIIQICINQRNTMKLSTLIHKAEAQGFHIIGASAVSVSLHHPTLTCHLHLQMERGLQEAADCAVLRKRVISWLC